MPCLFVALSLVLPRVTIAVLWLFTSWFVGVFSGYLLPVLGFIFAPVTLLWYSVVVNVFGGAWSIVPIVGLVIAVLIDLGQLGARK